MHQHWMEIVNNFCTWYQKSNPGNSLKTSSIVWLIIQQDRGRWSETRKMNLGRQSVTLKQKGHLLYFWSIVTTWQFCSLQSCTTLYLERRAHENGPTDLPVQIGNRFEDWYPGDRSSLSSEGGTERGNFIWTRNQGIHTQRQITKKTVEANSEERRSNIVTSGRTTPRAKTYKNCGLL
jgi:hypothetical protein